MRDRVSQRGLHKVAHLTTVHPAFDTRIFHRECRALADAGYNVLLVAPHPADVVENGIRIRALQRERSRVDRASRSVLQLLRIVREERPVLCHLHDPELLSIAGYLKAQGIRVIYDAHEDLAAQIMTKAWIPRPFRRPASLLAKFAISINSRVVDALVVATSGIAQTIKGADPVLVRNLPSLAELPKVPSRPYLDREPITAYVGGITLERGAREMVEAIGLVASALDARLVLAGEFLPPTLPAELSCLPGWSRVRAVGWQPRWAIWGLLAAARVGLVVLHPTPSYITSQPTKLYEYMAAGLPVVASDFPGWRSLVNQAGCGLLVNPRDPSAIAEAITLLLRDPVTAQAMGEAGKRLILDGLNWESESPQLVRLYDSILGVE